MNPLKQLLDSEETITAVELKIDGLELVALNAFRRLSHADQLRCVAALHDGAVPGTCEFVWTALVHAGIARMARHDFYCTRTMMNQMFEAASREVGHAFPMAPQMDTEKTFQQSATTTETNGENA